MDRTVIHLTNPINFNEAIRIIEWLKANVEHEYTGEGMSEITFQSGEDALLFKLLFSV